MEVVAVYVEGEEDAAFYQGEFSRILAIEIEGVFEGYWGIGHKAGTAR